MTRLLAAIIFLLASLPAIAADVGHDCAEGADEYVVALPRTPMPVPTPAPAPAPGS